MICPNQCVCQHAPFMDLSVSRWIQGLRREEAEPAKKIDNAPFSDVIFNEVLLLFKTNPTPKMKNQTKCAPFLSYLILGIFRKR